MYVGPTVEELQDMEQKRAATEVGVLAGREWVVILCVPFSLCLFLSCSFS